MRIKIKGDKVIITENKSITAKTKMSAISTTITAKLLVFADFISIVISNFSPETVFEVVKTKFSHSFISLSSQEY
jgi:hypothetical protein